MSRWEEYMSRVKNSGTACPDAAPDAAQVATFFPFHEYFANAPQPIFKGRSYEEDMEIAEGCFRHIKKIFTQLEVKVFNLFSSFFKSFWFIFLMGKLNSKILQIKLLI